MDLIGWLLVEFYYGYRKAFDRHKGTQDNMSRGSLTVRCPSGAGLASHRSVAARPDT
jgi:hypothetical protein